MAVPLWLVFGAGSLMLAPAGVFFAQCCAAVLGPELPQPELGRRPRLCVLVPAHNEEPVIRATLEGIKAQLSGDDRLLVIADNCEDNTASLARAAGATVLERTSEHERGKGFAISHGLKWLDADPPEVLIIVDADCTLSEGAIDTLSRLALATQRPVQAEYLLTAPDDPTPLATISALAFLVRNRVRPLGMAKLGLPCQATGSGMAFPWDLIRNTPALGANLVEDLVMGLDMALAGKPPLFCPSARVRSILPDRKRAATSQRTRWEHGHVATLMSRGPALVREGLRQGRPELIALAADLMVPPVALLVTTLSATTMVSGLLGWLVRRPVLAALPSLTGLGLVGAGTGIAWWRFAKDSVPLGVLFMAPVYVSWKIPMYLSLLLRGKQQSWVRTERTHASPAGATRESAGSNGASRSAAHS